MQRRSIPHLVQIWAAPDPDVCFLKGSYGPLMSQGKLTLTFMGQIVSWKPIAAEGPFIPFIIRILKSRDGPSFHEAVFKS